MEVSWGNLMNYYERHLGDYAKATSHLSLLEHGAYTLLLDRYYTNEAPIPAEKAYRWCMARSREEKAAVDAVLSEFFVRDGDEWYNTRADSDIARFKAKVPEKEEKKRNAKERQKVARQRRADLFRQLREIGITMDWRSTTNELVTELSRVTVTHGTATQTPDTRHQSPVPIHQSKALVVTEASTEVSQGTMTDATFACVLMKQRGCPRINPSNVDLLAAIGEGVTAMALADTAAEGIEMGKSEPFAWAIATARGRHKDGPKQVNGDNHAANQPGHKLSAVERVAQSIIDRREAERDEDNGSCIPFIAG